MAKKNIRLTKARQAKGLSMQELADKAKVSLATIYRLENGIRVEFLERVKRILKITGQRFDDVF